MESDSSRGLTQNKGETWLYSNNRHVLKRMIKTGRTRPFCEFNPEEFTENQFKAVEILDEFSFIIKDINPKGLTDLEYVSSLITYIKDVLDDYEKYNTMIEDDRIFVFYENYGKLLNLESKLKGRR